MMTPRDLQRFTSLTLGELVFGVVVFSPVVWPAFLRRRQSAGSPVVEALLQRVHELRQARFPARYARFRKAKTRAKLVAEARERIKREKELLRRRS